LKPPTSHLRKIAISWDLYLRAILFVVNLKNGLKHVETNPKLSFVINGITDSPAKNLFVLQFI